MVSNYIAFNLAAHKTVKRMQTDKRIPRKFVEEKKKKYLQLAIEVFKLQSQNSWRSSVYQYSQWFWSQLSRNVGSFINPQRPP